MNDDFMCPVCKSAPLITDYCPNCSRIGGYTAPPDAFPQAHRLALELECLLLSCTDTAATAKWWDSAHEALEQWRQFCAVEPPAVDSHWPKINMDISDKGAAPLQTTVEAAINQLVAALQESKGWMRDYADAIIRGAIDRTTPPLPDAQLCRFYDVDNFPDLVAAMDHHIEKLQAKLPPTPSLKPTRVREG